MTEPQPIRVAGIIANDQIDAQNDRFSPEALRLMEAQINEATRRGEPFPINLNFDPNRKAGTVTEAKLKDGKLFISASVLPDVSGMGLGVAGHTTLARGRGKDGEIIIPTLILDSVSVVNRACHPDYKLGGQELFPKKDGANG